MGMEPQSASNRLAADCPNVAGVAHEIHGRSANQFPPAAEGNSGGADSRTARELAEHWVEHDPSLVPDRPSSLLVEPSVLDPAEVRALLSDLNVLLAGAAIGPVARAAASAVAASGVAASGSAIHSLFGLSFDADGGAAGGYESGRELYPGDAPGEPCEEPSYESDAAPTGRDRRDPQLP